MPLVQVYECGRFRYHCYVTRQDNHVGQHRSHHVIETKRFCRTFLTAELLAMIEGYDVGFAIRKSVERMLNMPAVDLTHSVGLEVSVWIGDISFPNYRASSTD